MMQKMIFFLLLSCSLVACNDLPQRATLEMERVAGRDTTFVLRDVCADEACDSFYVVAPYDNIEALPLKLSVDVKEMLAKEVLLDDRCTILLCKAQELRSWSTVKRNVCDFSALPFGQGFSLTQALRMEKGKLQVLEE